MRASSLFTVLPLIAALAVPAFAQAPAASTKPAPKPAAKPAAKPAPKKPAPAAAAPLAAASPEQIEAAERTHFGPYECDLSQKVDVSMNPKNAGYVDVAFGKQVWTMKPVLSSTGALRLEDVKGKMLMLQIANKSMLMDVVAGRRIVDECVHAKQAEAARAVKAGGDSPMLNPPATPK
jgi:hypothetical protein